ncbi:MAG: hypothetical protein HZC17_04140 [Candidatus Omnitrophica bacterium]|nr:hypothetical protein [Candidatus Omnitrophota bacterium]
MKIRMFTVLMLLSFISFLGVQSIYAQMPPAWPDEYVGVWKLKRQGTEARYIVLAKNGTCKTTFNIDAQGKWQFDVDQQELRINWSDGWTDILLKQGGEYKNYGYSGNASAGDKPKDKFKAVKVDLDPFGYLGVWKLMMKDGTTHQITINPDGTATTDMSSGQKGGWEISGEKVHISWNNGGNDFLIKTKNGMYKLELNPPTTKGAGSSIALPIERTKAFLRGGVTASVI